MNDIEICTEADLIAKNSFPKGGKAFLDLRKSIISLCLMVRREALAESDLENGGLL